MITETYTFASPLVGYSSENGSSFSEFNPALGTLNSITLNDTVTATFSGGGSMDNHEAEYTISLNSNPFTMTATGTGNGSVGTSLNNFTSSSPGVLSAFIGSGMVNTSVSVFNKGSASASISSTFGTESLTYNYTPVAVPVPRLEWPASLLILAVGLIGLEWMYRRRVRGAAGA